MKIRELFEEEEDILVTIKNRQIARRLEDVPSPRDIVHHPLFKQDMPNLEWLERERRHYAETGRIGAVTGWFTEPLHLPIGKLKYVSGKMGEQSKVRNDSLDWLIDYMGRTNELPTYSSAGKEYPDVPLICVEPDQYPYVYEGNHRIMAADRLGWEHMPVDVRYFSGSEYTTGKWSPEELLKLHDMYKNRPMI